jgi:hypothetical protein
LEDPGVNEKIIVKWIFRKCDGVTWAGLIWLRIGTGGGLLRMQKSTFKFHKIR